MKMFYLFLVSIIGFTSFSSYSDTELRLGDLNIVNAPAPEANGGGRSPALAPSKVLSSSTQGVIGSTSFVCDARESLISFSSLKKFFVNASNINIDVKDGNVSVSVPSYIKTDCFVPEFSIEKVDQSETNGAQIFRLKIGNNSKELANFKGEMDQRILACFKEKGIISCDDGGGCSLKEDVEFTQPQITTFTKGLSKLKVDFTKPAQLVFGSPKKQGLSSGLTESSCFKDELLFSAKYLVKPNEAKENNLVRICEENNLAEIYQELSGGALSSRQQSFLYTALRKAQGEYAKEKYELLESLAQSIIEAEDYDTIRIYGKQYKKLADEIREDLIKPLSKELDLLIKRKKTN
jgi:hypothetical protein